MINSRNQGPIPPEESSNTKQTAELSAKKKWKTQRSLAVATWIGAALAPLVCVAVFHSEILYGSADLASSSLPVASMAVLLFLLALRSFLRRRWSGQREIVIIYAAVAGTVGISTMGMVQFLITTLAAPFWFADSSNQWREFWAHIPAWAAPRSPDVVKGFFLGHSSLYEPLIWRAWLVPVLAWSGFIAALLAAQFCLAHLLYPRWAQHERLTFPMVQLPLVLTEADPDNRGRRYVLLLGVGAAVLVQGMNALNYMIPSVPSLRVLPVEIGTTLPPPWNGVGSLWYSFYPSVIGLSALVPTEILFSSAFFFALTKAENLLTEFWGLRGASRGGAGFPYQGEQAQGAVMGMALMILWMARSHLRQTAHIAASRAAWIGLGTSLSVLYAYGIALHLRPATALVFFGVFVLSMLTVGWLRAAVGPMWNPGNSLGLLTPNPMPPAEGVGLAYLRWFSFGDFRAHALPTYVEMMRLTDIVRIERRRLVTLLVVASLLSIVASLWVSLDVYYRYGAASATTHQWRTYQGRLAFDIMQSQLNGLTPRPDTRALGAAGWGFVLVTLLQIARTRWFWWPWHPAGFLVAQTGALEWMWCPIVIAGIAKASLLRIGGLRLYARAVPFFIGLVVGDYAVAVVMTVLGWLVGSPLYKPFPI